MSVHTEFDQGSLIWVKGELEQTLARAGDALVAYREKTDAALLKHAQTHLHQAAGALQMVGLDGLARFGEEIEQLVACIARDEVSHELVTLAESAIDDVKHYLDDLMAGRANQPLTMLPRFAEMARARKASSGGAELFYPLLTELNLPRTLPARPLGPSEWGVYLREQRRRFEAALLRWIRDHDPAAAAVLGRALADIAAVQPQGLARAFWWTASAVSETLPSRAPLDIDLKQLLLRLNLQIRRLSDGSSKVAERLFRDLLYALAHDQRGSALAAQLHAAFDLAGLLVDADALAAPAEAEAGRMQARALRDEVAAAKEIWTRVATGQRDRLPTLQTEIGKLAERSDALAIDGLNVLWQAVASACQRYATAGVTEGDALEMATALLLADNALAIYPTRAPDFAAQAAAMAQRLADPSADTGAIPQLDEVSREAQERLLQAQLAQEMRSNLQQIEETLDSYFRDPGTQAALKQLDPGLRQIQGALMMLEKHDAVALLQASQQRIQRYAEQETPPESVELEELAEALSSLGFYIDAMAQGRDEGSELLAPSLAKLLGAGPEEEAAPVLAELEKEPELAPAPAAAAPVPEPEPQRALPQSDEAVDAELLEVYLEEAVEVLATIEQHLAQVRANPADREAATVLRRGFHTLKGSGRMVGLNHLGEVAWAVEQTLNKWLQAEQPVSAGLLDLIGDTHGAFVGWVAELANSGSAQVDESPWSERAEKLRHQLDHAAAEALPEVALETAEADAADNAAGPESDEVHVGDVVVSSTLFAIFRDEAAKHMAVLRSGSAQLSAGDALPGNFLLAAHTLGGIASTAGFRPLGELAYGLEHALQQAMKGPGDLARHAIPVAAAVDKMGTMLDAIIALQAPPDAEPELSALVVIVDDEPMDLSLDDMLLDADGAAPHAAGEALVAEPQAHEALSIELQDDAAETDPELRFPQLDDAAAPAAEAAELDELISLDLDAADEAPHAATAHAEPLVAEAPALEAIELTLDDAPLQVELVEDAAVHPAVEPLAAPQTVAEDDSFDLSLDALDIKLDDEPPALVAVPASDADVLPELIVAAAEPALDIAQGELDEDVPTLTLDEPADEELAAVDLPLVVEPTAHAVAETVVDAEPQVHTPEPVADVLPVIAEDIELVLGEAPLDEAVAESDSLAAAAAEPLLPVHDAASPLSDLLVLAGTASLAERKAELEATIVDEVDEQLLPVFVEEADELLPQIGDALRTLREGADPAAVATLKRTLHTLKGSARMSGAMRIGQATHEMESRLLASAAETPGVALLDELEADYDLIIAIYDQLTGRKAPPAPVAADGTAPAAAAPTQVAGIAQPLFGGATDAEGKTTIRVRSELVDELVNQAGEVAIARSRIEAEMLTVKTSLLDLTENVTRLRGQLRELEIQAESQMQARVKEIEDDHKNFDPLEFDRFTRLQEITRFIAESVNDVATVQHNMLKSLDDSSAALTAQNRMTKELQQSLMRVRMVPFSSVSDRLYRLVRQTGKEVAKKVNLELRGGRVEIDRGVLEKMISPFEHMLRNAIDHGLETAEERAASGKSEFGEVVVEVRQEGNELVVVLKDDGRGMNLPRIRAKGEALGLIKPGTEPTERDLMHLIFEPGFSTASSVTQISGRGIGMDVVKNEIGNLGGRVDVNSETGKGTTFTIHLPLTLAVTQVLLVKAGPQLLAIPSVMIEQVQELKQDALARLYTDRSMEWMGSRYPFAYFPRLIGDGQSVPEQKRFSTVLLLRSGAARMALHIDELVKNLEVVVKTIGPQLARIPGVAGATVLGNGDIVLIVNPLALLERGEVAPTQKKAAAAPEALHQAPLVMVVDDSLTVRKITSRLLVREGFQVVLAKDGVDALQQLQDVTPAVMLVDIEMPRMDGFELTRNIRNDDVTKTIPIIMITSRTAEKHKNYAMELGVNAFLGKPYQEDELLAHIRGFTGE
ncbi:chemosensory pili system protein ChpA (sensor histidine kinase/response regulator) [Andreprevotia lacus DSM 23236]|jgi:chemosensory pili system protein ChpA (sensor histidine kinase/response regulator)|uniref:Chemotaxis protein CheA n=1 Tax=Andreprevotia lacus DSM 23236 TaxID=1121001 RepID=A0A1W1XSH9_9NEIS|nr:Hpt domain-containing protein [Andreprevotia lacus]SMC26920.1 chemosensory pili system protein ChpA (sensor histidine kinase/response regulator) [Andreprevotia lacus DSM 23236]